MRFLSEEQIRQLLKPDEVIRAIRDAFARDFHQTLRMPVRTQLEIARGVLLLMPCYDSGLQAAGVKMVTVRAEAGVIGTYALLDAGSGEALRMMAATRL